MSDAMKKRLFGLGAVVVALGALGWMSMGGIEDQLVYYLEPGELLAKTNATEGTVRLGGMVVPGTFKWDQETHVVDFEISGKDGKKIRVQNKGNPPQMFREGIGAVVEGQLGEDGIFHSDKVMVKHDENYQSPDGAVSEADTQKMKSTFEGM